VEELLKVLLLLKDSNQSLRKVESFLDGFKSNLTFRLKDDADTTAMSSFYYLI
jgi:hypothetical protein